MININRHEARIKTINLLLVDENPNADFYANLFDKYRYEDSEMTPISPAKMGNVNINNDIVITEEVYMNLIRIRNVTHQTGKEVAYFIFGEEKPNGTVWLDTVVSTYRPSATTSADFSDIDPYLEKYVRKIESGKLDGENKQIVCHGHTHRTTDVCDNFSFGDLISYVELTNLHPLFKNRQVETIGMLMSPCGDFNFIMYENNPRYEGFYTFPAVYLRHSDGTEEKLPAYQNGDYLVNNNQYGIR